MGVVTGVVDGSNRLRVRLMQDYEDIDFAKAEGMTLQAFNDHRKNWLTHGCPDVPMYIYHRKGHVAKDSVNLCEADNDSDDEGLGDNPRAASPWHSVSWSSVLYIWDVPSDSPMRKWMSMLHDHDYGNDIHDKALEWVRRNPTERSLWPWSQNSCHFDVFIASCMSIFVASDACHFFARKKCMIVPFMYMQLILNLDSRATNAKWRNDARTDMTMHCRSHRFVRKEIRLTGFRNLVDHIDDFALSFQDKGDRNAYGCLMVKLTHSCSNPAHEDTSRYVSCGSVLPVPTHWYSLSDVDAALRDENGVVTGHRDDHKHPICSFREVVLNRIARQDATLFQCRCSFSNDSGAVHYYRLLKNPHDTLFPLTLWFGFEYKNPEVKPPIPELEFTIGTITYKLVSVIFKSPTHYVVNIMLFDRWFAYNDLGLPASTERKTRQTYYTSEIDRHTYHTFRDYGFDPSFWCYVRVSPSDSDVYLEKVRKRLVYDDAEQASTRVPLQGLEQDMFNSLELLG